MTSLKQKSLDSHQNQDELSHKNKIKKKNIVIISVCIIFLGVCGEFFSAVMNKLSLIRSNISNGAKLGIPKLRTTWAKENERITDRMFYCLFRMQRPYFNASCSKIERAVGGKDFNRKDTLKNYKKRELLLLKVAFTMHIVNRQETIFLAKSS